MIFDTHTHLNADEFQDDIPGTIQRAKELEVTEMAVVGFNDVTIDRTLELIETYPEIYGIIGWHPEDAKDYNRQIEDRLMQQLTHEKIVAMGEMGLDYHWDTSPRDVQRRVFAREVAVAKEMNLPISIHNRDATEDTYKILKEADIRDIGGIMHSFNGDPEWMKRFLDLGMHISFSGVVTFKNTHEVHESALQVPMDKMLVETDAPYLAPMPYRGKRNEPGYTRYVVEDIAKRREMDWQELAEQTRKNAHKLFKIED